ncbi:ZN574 protein, partial [Vireo altiloquus]|nr:ZN574 protein [Vireo altiloquus]
LFQSQELWLAHRQGHRAPPPLARVDLEHSYRKPEEGEAEESSVATSMTTVATTVTTVASVASVATTSPGVATALQLLLYECGECLQLFQSPKDFLEHQ